MAPRMMEVGLNFSCDRLLPGEECYFRLPGRMVVVQGAGLPALVFYRSGRLICDCPAARANDGECQHTQALRGGLWAHLFMCPKRYGIKTYTGDWCQEMGHRLTIHTAAVPESSVTVY
ncbi:MAG: hypothetical protein H5T61_04940 [Thermoflexales bacterium]|nr:hypothetical protein [Thermoflexales bacterium]